MPEICYTKVLQGSGRTPTFVVIKYQITDNMQAAYGSADTPATPKMPETGAVPGQKYDLKATAALIKKRLTQLYPGVKFSVRSEWFSMGNAIRVGWVDGPAEKPVQEFLNQFKAGSYDSQAESYEYRLNCPFDGKYINGSRTYSSRYCEAAVRELDLMTAPSLEAQLRALGDKAVRGNFYEAGRSYGLKLEHGNLLFTVTPARQVEAHTRRTLEASLKAQGYEVEAGEEEGDYVLAAYARR